MDDYIQLPEKYFGESAIEEENLDSNNFDLDSIESFDLNDDSIKMIGEETAAKSKPSIPTRTTNIPQMPGKTNASLKEIIDTPESKDNNIITEKINNNFIEPTLNSAEDNNKNVAKLEPVRDLALDSENTNNNKEPKRNIVAENNQIDNNISRSNDNLVFEKDQIEEQPQNILEQDEQETVVQDNGSLIEGLQLIDEQIQSLENLILKNTNKEQDSKEENSSVVNNFLPLESENSINILSDKMKLPIDGKDNMGSSDDIIEIINNPINKTSNFKSQTNNTNNLKNQINVLKQQRQKILKDISNINSTTNNKNLNNLVSDNNAVVKYDNFTPNFQFNSQEQEESVERAVDAEAFFGGDPTMVVDQNTGTEAIIDKNKQSSFNDAVAQHGGIEEAIQSSINKQTYVNSTDKNFNNTDSTFNNFTEETNNIDAAESGETLNQMPDNSADISKNTADTVAAINNLSKQFSALASSVLKGFGNLSSSMKDIKTSQTNITNNMSKGSPNGGISNNSSNNKGSASGSGSTIPAKEIRGDFALNKDVGISPENMGGSNLTGRM